MPSTSESLWSARETEWLSFCKGKGAVCQLWKKLGNRRLKKYQTYTAPGGEIFSSWSECIVFMSTQKLQDRVGMQAVQGKLDVTESESSSTASASTESTRNDEKFVLSPTSKFDESIWNIGDLMKVQITESLYKSSERKPKDSHGEELPASSDEKPMDVHYNDDENDETDDDANIPEASKMVEVPIQVHNVVSAVGSSNTRGTKFETDRSHFQQHSSGQESGHAFKKTKQEGIKSSANEWTNPILNENPMKSGPDTDQDTQRVKNASPAIRAKGKGVEDNQSLPLKRRRTPRVGVEHGSKRRANKQPHRRRENLQGIKIREHGYQRRGKGKRTREKSEKRLKVRASDEVRKRASRSRRRSLRKPNDLGDTESRITTDSDMLISILMTKYMEQRRSKRRRIEA